MVERAVAKDTIIATNNHSQLVKRLWNKNIIEKLMLN